MIRKGKEVIGRERRMDRKKKRGRTDRRVKRRKIMRKNQKGKE